MSDLFSVEGKVAVVTGGATGIGRRFAQALCSAGARVCIASRDIHGCEAVAAELSTVGECFALGLDVSNPQDIQRFCEDIEAREPHLDILINNAATSYNARMSSFPWSAWEDVMRVNVAGPFTLISNLRPLLEKSATKDCPARIINVGSVVGYLTEANGGYSYVASKSAIHQLTRVLANELSSKHITVNAIAPGPFDSRMMNSITNDESIRQQVASRIPLGRIGSYEDAAGALLFLCSRASDYVTGLILPVDGGLSIAPPA